MRAETGHRSALGSRGGVPAGGLWAPRGTKGLPSHHLPLGRRLESNRPLLTRFFKLQFFYVPVKRSCGPSASPAPRTQTPPLPTDSPRHPGPAVGPRPWAQQGGKARRCKQAPGTGRGCVGAAASCLGLCPGRGPCPALGPTVGGGTFCCVTWTESCQTSPRAQRSSGWGCRCHPGPRS